VLVTYPDNIAGGYTVVPGDGTSHFGLVLNAADPPVCTQGYEGTQKRVPSNTSDRPANTDARCTAPRGSKTSVRGAQNAPAPSNRSARVLPGSSTSRTGANGTYADEPDTAVSRPYLTGYDPTSGLALGAGGAPLTMGQSGGQAQAFGGEDSWTWLLLGPMSR
jgi:phospholipid/cholesterol/gamma-HCH transport system substrate-binding protein